MAGALGPITEVSGNNNRPHGGTMNLSISQFGKAGAALLPEALEGPGKIAGAGHSATANAGGAVQGPAPDRSGVASVLENSLSVAAPSPSESADQQSGPGDSTQGAGKKLGEDVLGGIGKYYGAVSKGTGMLANLGIPEISQFAAAGSVAAKATSDLANVGVTGLKGGDVKQAAHQALGDVAQTAEGQAFNALPIPGGGKSLGKLVKTIPDRPSGL